MNSIGYITDINEGSLPTLFRKEKVLPCINFVQFTAALGDLHEPLAESWQSSGQNISLQELFDSHIEKWIDNFRKGGSCYGESIENLIQILHHPLESKTAIQGYMSEERAASFQILTEFLTIIKTSTKQNNQKYLPAAISLVQEYHPHVKTFSLPSITFDKATYSRNSLKIMEHALLSIRQESSNIGAMLLGSGTPGHAMALQFNPSFRCYNPGGEHVDFESDSDFFDFIHPVIELGLEKNTNHKTTLDICVIQDPYFKITSA